MQIKLNQMMPSSASVLAAMLGLLLPQLASADPALQGCWRSQHVQVTQADQREYAQNGDCVTEYEGKRARSRCYGAAGETESVSSVEVIKSGLLRITPIDATSGEAKGQPGELQYKIDGQWMMVERQLAQNSDNRASKASKLNTLAIREAASTCKPHGDNPNRIGNTARSSIALRLPSGWKPLLIDPTSNKTLLDAINTSFFIGSFVPQESVAAVAGAVQNPAQNSAQRVIVLEDTRIGPQPVREKDFAAIKKRFVSELGSAQQTCDLPDRVCAQLRMPENGLVYTEMLILKGRLVKVSGASNKAELDTLRKSVQVFVEQLRRDNPQ